jgi:hypothetical protein
MVFSPKRRNTQDLVEGATKVSAALEDEMLRCMLNNTLKRMLECMPEMTPSGLELPTAPHQWFYPSKAAAEELSDVSRNSEGYMPRDSTFGWGHCCPCTEQ